MEGRVHASARAVPSTARPFPTLLQPARGLTHATALADFCKAMTWTMHRGAGVFRTRYHLPKSQPLSKHLEQLGVRNISNAL